MTDDLVTRFGEASNLLMFAEYLRGDLGDLAGDSDASGRLKRTVGVVEL